MNQGMTYYVQGKRQKVCLKGKNKYNCFRTLKEISPGKTSVDIRNCNKSVEENLFILEYFWSITPANNVSWKEAMNCVENSGSVLTGFFVIFS